jgi:hypothetical protein
MGYQFFYNVSVINEGNTSTKIKNKMPKGKKKGIIL